MTPTPALLELDRASRRLGGRAVLRELSFTLQRGEVVGLLGVNGAGKSTTLALIAGIMQPSSGEVRVEGRAAADACQRIGWVPENVPLWPELTVAEALDGCARLRGLARDARKTAIERELARLELGDIAQRLCGQLSLGQKRRVGLAQALLHEPDLLVLDEPGNGLDPVQAMQLRDTIGKLSPRRGIILSSHDLAEVEAMCGRVVILHDGRVRLDAPLENRRGQLDAQFRAIAGAPASAAA
ncbi:MAG: ABC transporter involved in cytochrome c biogenesis, ATPase component CcmA [Rhodanobacteraceae bacterium]|jgi:ABC-2 type transport system ATP-binding protein|nr:MAG: ABC transporter involved in cytochrome c biogenesis, ATPase component CcmA [Rhodanobacteraceae bacterium]